jgi:methylmalonyl-CoA/ethylmalonyl-CoA epimerase
MLGNRPGRRPSRDQQAAEPLPMTLPPSEPAAEFISDLGATFDHFAIATRRIRDLLPLWMDALGGIFGMGADNPDVGWRTVRIEFGSLPCVELIEPLEGSVFFDGFFRKFPQGGLHHVTFLVDDIEAAYARLEQGGYQPFGADESWNQLFVHPKQANGVLVQLMKRHGYDGPAMSLDDVLSGRGHQGTGLLSP